MATIGQLRTKAKALGASAADVRKARTADDLQELILGLVMNGGATTTKTTKAPARKTATKPTRKATATKPATRKATTPTRKAATPVKATRKPAVTKNDEDAGRHALGKINFSQTDGWNARAGSPPDLIVASLRKHKGNREAVYTALVKDVWTFVGRKMKDGNKRSLASAQEMLRYRISRTAWDFAMKTGQHEKSDNRIEYGSGTNGNGATKKATPRKATGGTRTPAKAKTVTRTRTPTRTPARKRTTARTPVAKKKTRR